MLTPKLLRIEESTIQEVEELAQQLSEKEHISFSALVRKLIRIGLDNMENKVSFLEKVKKTTDASNLVVEKEKVLTFIKNTILHHSERGDNHIECNLFFFYSYFKGALDQENIDFNQYYALIQFVLDALASEGFKIIPMIRYRSDLYVRIEW